MRFFFLTLLLANLGIISLTPINAVAQEHSLEEPVLPEPEQPDPDAIQPKMDDVPLASEDQRSDADERLVELFATLKKTRNNRAAKRIADEIWGEWFRSGSASIDLMMKWSNDAVVKEQFNVALDFLDQVVTRSPEYAEGWNRRATLHYNMLNFNKSMVDIQKVLALEPRHFGALSGMATILERNGKKKAALNAWQRALDIYPAMKSGQAALIRLSDDLEGDPA